MTTSKAPERNAEAAAYETIGKNNLASSLLGVRIIEITGTKFRSEERNKVVKKEQS